jgi:hypothetical protein
MLKLVENEIGVDDQIDLMIRYQNILESKSVIVQNDEEDEHPYSLYTVENPFPTYNDYLNGNEFDEGELIAHCQTYEQAIELQKGRIMRK